MKVIIVKTRNLNKSKCRGEVRAFTHEGSYYLKTPPAQREGVGESEEGESQLRTGNCGVSPKTNTSIKEMVSPSDPNRPPKFRR